MKNSVVLSHQDAMLIVATVQAALEEKGQGAAVVVADEHGEVIALLRTDGCPLPSIQNALNKAYTAARQRVPSANVGRSSREKGYPLTNFGDLRYIGWGGGLPIVVNDQVLGAVGVSGLPETEDIELAQRGLDALYATLAGE